ncbi:DUF397 domain-containing protein [Streptomyces sp. 900105755]|uniref:DUF397 domain-containing protein n=1 Tax=Streptomyces sp. Ag109_O5-10 TaxID=1855349 RepID=UPI00089731F8|nr:DUF397 domain-containing protein [Streptomyces sp. Ag109_O5-10]SEE84719.1 protein of unknown function [Streptomyces sp. Ag109_O5-10]
MTSTLRWFKSSYSNDSGGQCVETAYTWRKSSHSDGGGNCLEISPCPRTIHIRDSKAAPDGPHLTVSPAAWAAFLRSAG